MSELYIWNCCCISLGANELKMHRRQITCFQIIACFGSIIYPWSLIYSLAGIYIFCVFLRCVYCLFYHGLYICHMRMQNNPLIGCHLMMTSSNGNIFHVTGHLIPVTPRWWLPHWLQIQYSSPIFSVRKRYWYAKRHLRFTSIAWCCHNVGTLPALLALFAGKPQITDYQWVPCTEGQYEKLWWLLFSLKRLLTQPQMT